MPTANVIDVANEDVLARDVLEDELGNYASKELEEHFATIWERNNVRACVRTWEEPEEGGKLPKSYLERKRQFKTLAAKKEPTPFSMAPELAAAELERYQRMPWSTIVGNEDYKRRWHELEDILGRERTDFSKPRKPIPAADYDKRVAAFLGMPHSDRLRAVEQETDRTLLGYIHTDDPERDVRDLAQARMFKLASG